MGLIFPLLNEFRLDTCPCWAESPWGLAGTQHRALRHRHWDESSRGSLAGTALVLPEPNDGSAAVKRETCRYQAIRTPKGTVALGPPAAERGQLSCCPSSVCAASASSASSDMPQYQRVPSPASPAVNQLPSQNPSDLHGLTV